ncbi:PREDICTED: uncharacterized protein LOC109157040 [Ipomoea nil]|uniref:uncharacterized protein LOC109157040 n=1 Tax=Ipomoea nil TaxID=35883 RepID=UPI000900B5E1|nr:PREDICTED: uncharacterized protein LOC109157040 [Ipomoea nil]
MGGKIDRTINNGTSPSIFRINGQNFHRIGSLAPSVGIQPKFSQLYIHDTENEIENRFNSLRAKNNGSTLHVEVVHDIKQTLDEHNVLVKSFRMAKSFIESNPQTHIRMRLIGKRTKDARTYALPTTSEVAALIVGDIDPYMGQRDIIVESRSGVLKRISELNPAYLPLQYPILFPYGEDGFREDIQFATRLFKKECFTKRQFLVDAYTMVESSRLLYIRLNQKALRCEAYKGLSDALTRGEVQPSSQDPAFMDTIISAEIPDKVTENEYYKHVGEFMLHGPCGAARIKSPCMANGKCSKHFPKRYIDASHFDQDGYPLSIKYLFKYVNKGNDRVTAEFYKATIDGAGNEIVDEINMYYDCRYVSACEATWRLFSFEVQYRTPPVERLSFHLPDCQSVVFQDDDTIDNVLNRETVGQSMFNAWFVANQNFKEASLLTYIEMPTKFVWKKDIREWHPRKKGSSIGRIFYLDDDKEYIDVINEASYWSNAHSLKKLFVVLLTSSSIIRPENVWNQVWKHLSEDAQHYQMRVLKQQELSYDSEQLKTDSEVLCAKLTEEQGLIYDTVIQDIENKKGGLFFVYGYGETRKTFLWRALSAAVRCKGQIVLNVASSGIASLLLPGGRTAHSRFAIPIAINEDSTCNIKQGSDLAELLIKTSLIIWDEAPMMHKHCFEALDRIMRDLLRFVDPNSEMKTFGGKTVVLGGDFRQILPVVPKGTRQDIVSSAINSSYLWDSCKVLRLTKNLRLSSVPNGGNRQALQEFADWIANIGDGKLGGRNNGFADVEIPMHITNAVNDYMTELHNAKSRSYYSSDAVCKADGDNGIFGDVHTLKFLNSIRVSGLPNHTLTLKIGSPVMLMRNIDHSLGLCIGTRLIITKLADHVIEGEILTGPNKGTKVLIPRMSMAPSDPRLPFKFQRRQFPLMLSYAMTINKSQGQTLTYVGLVLKKPVFVHGQLYVAASRVNNPDGLKILIAKDSSSTTTSTTNVVYHEVFNNL